MTFKISVLKLNVRIASLCKADPDIDMMDSNGGGANMFGPPGSPIDMKPDSPLLQAVVAGMVYKRIIYFTQQEY